MVSTKLELPGVARKCSMLKCLRKISRTSEENIFIGVICQNDRIEILFIENAVYLLGSYLKYTHILRLTTK